MVLAIKSNVNDYYPLRQEYLDIISKTDSLTNLENIDAFTSKFTMEELIESIKRANIVALEKIENASLVILFYENKKVRELPIYTKENIDYIQFNVEDFFLDSLSNKNFMNQIKNFFMSKNHTPEDLKQLMLALKNDSVLQITNAIAKLSYYSKRILKTYIWNEILPKLEDSFTLNLVNKNND